MGVLCAAQHYQRGYEHQQVAGGFAGCQRARCAAGAAAFVLGFGRGRHYGRLGGGTAVGGTGVDVGGTGVAVGGTGVDVGGTGVAVGGTGVDVGGTGVSVGIGVAVGGRGVDVGGTGVAVGIGVGVVVAARSGIPEIGCA